MTSTPPEPEAPPTTPDAQPALRWPAALLATTGVAAATAASWALCERRDDFYYRGIGFGAIIIGGIVAGDVAQRAAGGRSFGVAIMAALLLLAALLTAYGVVHWLDFRNLTDAQLLALREHDTPIMRLVMDIPQAKNPIELLSNYFFGALLAFLYARPQNNAVADNRDKNEGNAP